MRTFADKAKSIQNRYPHANRVSADKEAMMSELEALYDEQERAKQLMQLEQQDGLFEPGGETIPTWEEANAFNVWKDEQYKTNPLLKTYEPTGDTLQFGQGVDTTGANGKEEKEPFNPRMILNAASNLAPAMSNLINGLTMDDPHVITPHMYNPTAKFRGTDITPYETALQQELASSKYSLLNAGADFDTTSSGVRKLSDTYGSNRGKMVVEKANLDNKEGARIDAITNDALKYNTENLNQADMDVALRQDIIDQRRRDYFTALSQNVGDMFRDESDRRYADELEPHMSNLGILKSLYEG